MRALASRHPVLAVALLVLLAAAGGAALQRTLQSDPSAPPAEGQPRLGGSFELQDRDGRVFTDRNLLGRPFALYFGYTRCPDVCPTTLMRLASLRRALGTEGETLQIVFVSVDPEIDTPAAVGAYADLFRASIVGLGGTPGQIARIAAAYRVIYTRVPQPSGGYNIDHSTYAYLVDRNGRFVDVVSPLDSEDEARTKLRQLLSR